MKKYLKILASTLLVIVMCLALVACKGNGTTDTSTGTSTDTGADTEHVHIFEDGKCSCGEVEAEVLHITSQPKSLTILLGESAVFSVEVKGGTEPYTYQWYCVLDGTEIMFEETEGTLVGSQASTLTITPKTAAVTEIFCFIKDDADNYVKTERVTLTCNEIEGAELQITKHPIGCTILPGESGTFSVEVSGGKAPYTYQWYYVKYGEIYTVDEAFPTGSEGTKTSILTITPDDKDDWGYIYCNISDAQGSFVSTGRAELHCGELAIATHPQSASAGIKESKTFTVEVMGGTAPYSYQWQIRDGEVWKDLSTSAYYNGVTTKTLKVISTKACQERYHCVITDAAGDKVSTVTVSFTVTAPDDLVVKINDGTGYVSVAGDQTATLKVNLTGGTAPYSYKWETKKDSDTSWTHLSEITEDTLTVNSSNVGSYYRVTVTDKNGWNVKSQEVRVNEGLSVTLNDGETAMSIYPDERVEFRASVTGGTAPYTYVFSYMSKEYEVTEDRWDKGAPIYDNEATWVITCDCYFKVTVTDATGKTGESQIIDITVKEEFSVKIGYGESYVTVGKDTAITLRANVTSGEEPYTYLWYSSKDNGATWVEGTTTSHAGVVAEMAGWILKVVVTDADGRTAESQNVLVVVENELAVMINNGETEIDHPDTQYLYLNANVINGTGTYTYQWYYKETSEDEWELVSTDSTFEAAGTGGDIEWVKVVVTDANGNTATSQILKINFYTVW